MPASTVLWRDCFVSSSSTFSTLFLSLAVSALVSDGRQLLNNGFEMRMLFLRLAKAHVENVDREKKLCLMRKG